MTHLFYTILKWFSLKLSITIPFIVATLIVSSGCAQNNCTKIPGLEPNLKAGNVILLGEMHGTQEAPFYIEQIACNGLGKDLSVTVGLELPKVDQPQLDAFLNSNGTKSDKQKFLNLPYWTKGYQDGRTSQAMFELIDNLRKMKKAGKAIDVIFIDDSRSRDREVTMSNSVLEEYTKTPNNLFLVLTGNIHNRISEGSGRMGELVAKQLEMSKVISLAQSYSGGSAWVDMGGGIGVQNLKGHGRKEVGVFLDKEMKNYHGILEMDSIHASLPAKDIFDFDE